MATAGMTEQLEVDLGDRRYPIVIGPNVLDRQELLLPHIAGSQVCVITNETVAPLYLDRVRAALAGIRQVDAIVLPDGEAYKTVTTYSRIIDDLMRLRHNRTTTLVALGGGVVGDLTGFVAATYQRGVDFIQLPTTLLAQVDSSVGGKTGVNHPQGKNMIGAFHQPVCVLADTGVLSTLPRREYLSGVAEVIKYGIIRDAPFFAWLETQRECLLQLDQPVLAHAVRTSCAIKAAVVESDEREVGLRAILNYGHTFGHAIESLTHYRVYLHGEAVAIGMVMAADLSFRQGWLSGRDAARIKRLVDATGLPTCPPRLDAEAFLDAMGMDKKVVDGRLRFVVLHALGKAVVSDAIDPVLLRQTLAAYERLCHG
jgi:3-dehydroquinate synthase